MPALNTDLLKKLSRKWTGQIGAAGVSDNVGTTIPLSSTTNLPTDTAVVATIDRVDSNGVKTPTLEESVIGVVSGSNLTTCVRGAEGTAQAHAAGAVVEILITAKGYNDIIDHLLVEHSQLGVHTSALVTSLKASGAVVNTGTSDVTIVTPKAIADSTIAKVGAAGSDLDTASDTVKFATAKAIKDAHNVPSVVPGTSGNILTSDGTDWTSATPGGSNFALKANCILNGGFTVNQRVYASNATLAAGIYGHDRWKAGSSGGDYTFTQLAQSTVITIKAGKSLIQVVEDKNVIGGNYTLSWTGTAQAQYGKDSATPSSGFAASPIAITGQAAGTVMSVEFNAGTLSNVVLNSGTTAITFMPMSFADELMLCQRYYEKSYSYASAPLSSSQPGLVFCIVPSNTVAQYQAYQTVRYQVQKRAITTPVTYPYTTPANTGRCSKGDLTDLAAASATVGYNNESSFVVVQNATAQTTTSLVVVFHWTCDAEL